MNPSNKLVSIFVAASLLFVPSLAKAMLLTNGPVADHYVAPDSQIEEPYTGPATTGGVVPVSAPVVTPVVSGGSSGGGSYSSGSGGNVSVVAPIVVANCIKAPILGFGRANDAAEVTKLQSFLKNHEHIDVDVNGTYDTKTVEAVKIFQDHYKNIIMAPWGASIPTGEAYITTIKQVNALACNKPLTLSIEELAIISKRGVKVSEPAPAVTVTVVPVSTESTVQGPAKVVTPEITNSEASTSVEAVVAPVSNTAAASNSSPSVLRRFWGFVKSLFY